MRMCGLSSSEQEKKDKTEEVQQPKVRTHTQTPTQNRYSTCTPSGTDSKRCTEQTKFTRLNAHTPARRFLIRQAHAAEGGLTGKRKAQVDDLWASLNQAEAPKLSAAAAAVAAGKKRKSSSGSSLSEKKKQRKAKKLLAGIFGSTTASSILSKVQVSCSIVALKTAVQSGIAINLCQ
jgi:hypothetical protein